MTLERQIAGLVLGSLFKSVPLKSQYLIIIIIGGDQEVSSRAAPAGPYC